MSFTQHVNPQIAVHFIAAEERHQAMQKAAQQARSIKESKLAFGRAGAGRPSMIRRGIGVALTRAGERLLGTPAVTTQLPTLTTNG